MHPDRYILHPDRYILCLGDGRLVFPVQQLEVLIERILHQIDEFHMTFINGVIYSPSIYFDFTFTHKILLIR